MRRIRTALIVFLSLGFGGSTSIANHAQCHVFDLALVFREPLPFAGKRFCGRAYMLHRERGVTFYPSEQEAKYAPYETALIPMARSPRLERIARDQFVTIRGKLTVDRGCITGIDEEDPGKIVRCSPFRRPIFIELDSGEP